MTPQAIMLFAAGFGTRMRPLTDHLPKPLIPVADRPLIDHALDQVDSHGVLNIVVNLHYHAQKVKDHLAGRNIRFSLETPDILETGGGLRHALPLLGDGPVFTMNTDMVWAGPNPLSVLAQSWDPRRMDALLLCLPKERATGYSGAGNFMIEDDGRAHRGPGVVYSGLQILKTDGLLHITEQAFSLNILWDKLIATKRLYALKYTGAWCDVGTPDGIALAEAMLEKPDV